MSTTATDKGVEYPTSDGRPMAETEIHRENMVRVIDMLKDYFRDRPEVYVSGNMLMFYEEGNNRRHVSPDVFVVFGVSTHLRDNYKVWEESKPTLDLVVEFTSKSTRSEDTQTKKRLYRTILQVREYLLFDPYQDYLKPAQQLFRLDGDDYVEVPPEQGRLPSRVLGVDFERDGHWLRLYDRSTRQWVPTRAERAERAERKLAEFEAENARLRAELESKKRDPT